MQFEKKQLTIFILFACATVGLLVGFYILIIVRNYKANIARRLEFFKDLINTQESERERIGRNLHDEMGALLSLVKLNIDGMIHSGSKQETAEIGGRTKIQIDDALKEIRKIINDLVPRNIQKYGLVAALEDLANSIYRNEHIKISFTHSLVSEKRFPKNVEVDLYRIIQELLNNSIKHSGGSLIKLFLQTTPSGLLIQCGDNGKGFDTSIRSNGMGIENLKTRINLYHGKYDVKSEPGKGTECEISFLLANLY